MKLTKQSVLDAYAKTGLTPKEGNYYNFVDKEINSACVAGVLWLNEHGIRREQLNEINIWLIKKYGKTAACSLVRGFDGSERSSVLHDENAYSLGLELRKELLGKEPL